MKRISHVIFDVDGTLLDTESIYTQTTNKILAPFGLTLEWSVKQKLMGRKPIDACRVLIESYGLSDRLTPEQLLERRLVLEKAMWPETKAMPGARTVVEGLAELGVPMAIATGSHLDALEMKFSGHRDWFRHFAAIVTASDSIRGKPAPDIFVKAAELLGKTTDLGTVLVVEDAVIGVQAALAAGMRVLAVPDPNLVIGNEAVFSQADQTLHSLEEFDPTFWGLPQFPKVH